MEITQVINSDQNCIQDFQIAHYRKNEGYIDSYFDAEDMDESLKRYKIA